MSDIYLRPPLPTDADLLYPLLIEGHVTDTIAWDGPDSLDQLKQGMAMRALQVLSGEKHYFTIVEAESDGPIGTCDIRLETPDASRANVGLWIGEPFQGKGYGTQVIEALVRYGFGRLGLDRIEADVFVGNWASRRIFEKNGFALERTEAAALVKRGQPVDEWMFGLERGEEEAPG